MTSFLLNERQQKIAAEWTNFQTKFIGDFVRYLVYSSACDEGETPTPQQMSIGKDTLQNSPKFSLKISVILPLFFAVSRLIKMMSFFSYNSVNKAFL